MKILVGGIGKAEARGILEQGLGSAVEVEVSSDFEAAESLVSGEAAYYLGTCHTGAGAALGVLVPLLGPDRCHAFGRHVPTPEQLRTLMASEKVAYGFPVDNVTAVVGVFVDVLAGLRPGEG